jgi:hypothetical protein
MPPTSQKTSTTSDPDQSSSTAVATGESSVTSVPTTPIEPRDFNANAPPRRQRKVKYDFNANKKGKNTRFAEPPPTKYWSEYDHPEDGSGDENGYYIYVDQNASDKFLGQETFEQVYTKLKEMLNKTKQPPQEDEENRPRLSPHPDDALSSSPTDSEDEPLKQHWPRHSSYGAIERKATPGRRFSTYTALVDPASPAAVVAPLSSHRQVLAFLTLGASTVICIIVATLAATGRRKQRGEVDAGVLFGVVASQFFALVGMVSVLTNRESMSMVKWLLVSAVFIAVCIADGALIGWVV